MRSKRESYETIAILFKICTLSLKNYLLKSPYYEYSIFALFTVKFFEYFLRFILLTHVLNAFKCLLTLNFHWILWTHGLALMAHSKYTSSFSLMLLGFRVDPNPRDTLGKSAKIPKKLSLLPCILFEGSNFWGRNVFKTLQKFGKAGNVLKVSGKSVWILWTRSGDLLTSYHSTLSTTEECQRKVCHFQNGAKKDKFSDFLEAAKWAQFSNAPSKLQVYSSFLKDF